VGGDYYDVVKLPGDRIGVVVADVAGKGWTAAMLAACLQGAFAASAAGDPDLPGLFFRVNNFLCERSSMEMFATMLYGVLDRAGRFEFVNAGHVMPLVAHASGEVVRVESSNFPLGLFPEATFEVDSVQLQPGDTVLVFSDGVTEARDPADEFYGDNRMKEFLEGYKGRRSAEELASQVMAEVRKFVGSAPQADDVTLVVLRFGP